MASSSEHECWLEIGEQRCGPLKCRLVEEATFERLVPQYSWHGILFPNADIPLTAGGLFSMPRARLILDDGRSGEIHLSSLHASLPSQEGQVKFKGDGMLTKGHKVDQRSGE